MSWLNDVADDEQLAVEELRGKGITGKPTTKKEVGLFDGAASSPFRGAAAGFAKVADTAMTPIDAVVDRVGYSLNDVSTNEFIEPYSEYKDKKDKARDSLFLEGINALEDKENTGTVGQVVGGIADYATRQLIGSMVGGLWGGAAVTSASEGNYKYKDLTSKGVDSATAAKVAGVDSVVAGVSSMLPAAYGLKGSGGLVKDAVLSVGGATGLSTAGQAVSGELLESAGYEKQAKGYDITATSLSIDAGLNALIFGASRGHARYVNKQVQAELDALDVDAKATQVQSALEVNRMQHEDATAPVDIVDPIQQNKHLVNLNAATDQIKAGQPINVPHNIQGEPKRKAIDFETTALPPNAKLIARKAQQDGVDPTVALTISQMESNFNHTAKNKTSTAHGLFQVLDKTWKGQGGGDRNSIDEQIKQGLKHIKHANNYIAKNIGRSPVAHEQYLGHLLGPSGAVHVLKADQNAPLIDIVRGYDAKNASAIVNNNGMKGMTVGEAVDKWRKKWNTVSSRFGGESVSTAHGLDGSSYDVAYEVKSLDDLIASNDALYGVNPNYPTELQPRDRTREASRQQIERMADELRPEFLGESRMLGDGAPIIGLDNVVESGNGRTLAIGKAYADGKADAYNQFVNDYANSRGWDISGVNNPVLVRTRLTDTDRVQFTKLANEASVAQYSASERAASDVGRLPDTSLLKLNADGSINLDGSMDFVRGFIAQLPQSERGAVQDGGGKLSQEGKRRMESAIVRHAYGDDSLVNRLTESLDDDGKTVLNALLRVAPQLSQLNGLVKQGGRNENTIAKDLAQAAQKLSDLKANGLKVDDYLNQGQLIDDGLSDGAKQFLSVFDTNKRSAKGIADHIQSKIDEIDSMGDPRQGSLFGEELIQVKSVQDQIVEMLSNSSKYGADYINDAAKVAASVYHSTAKKMGITADELFARFPMRINDGANGGKVPDANVAANSIYKQIATDKQEIDAIRTQYENTPQWMKAPNGKDTALNEQQWLQVRTPSFKKWFGDWEGDAANASKIVDANGEPLVVYHGSKKKFTIFDRDKQNNGWLARGFYFTPDKQLAKDFGRSVTAAFLDVKKPFNVKGVAPSDFYTEVLKRYNINNADAPSDLTPILEQNGVDGVFMKHWDIGEIYTAINPNKIKSATGNSGAFSTDDNNIYYQNMSVEDAVDRNLIAIHELKPESLLHADRMGGLAVPSLGVVKKGHLDTGFGDIALIAPTNLIDPKGYAKPKVYGADIYSPRYPEVEYKFDTKELSKFDSELDEARAFFENPNHNISADNLEHRPHDRLMNDNLVKYKFLADNGISVEKQFKTETVKSAATDIEYNTTYNFIGELAQSDFVFDRLDWDGNFDPASLLSKIREAGLVDEIYKMYVEAAVKANTSEVLKKNAERKRRILENFDDQAKRNKLFQELNRVQDYLAGRTPKPAETETTRQVFDRSATAQMINDIITQRNLTSNLRKYVDSTINRTMTHERIRDGYTPAGKPRYREHNLDNIVKILKKDIVGGEAFNYGLGSVRAKYTPQLKSLADIKNHADKLVDAQEFQQVKSQVELTYSNIQEKVNEFGTYDGWNNFDLMMQDIPSIGLDGALDANGFKNVPQDIKGEIVGLVKVLKDMPTEYFEAKISRVVNINEFSGAVVPENIDPETLAILAKNGITDIQYFGENQTKAEAMEKFKNQFFQRSEGLSARGSITFSPAKDGSTITLNKDADFSTFVHELGHHFLEMHMQLKEQGALPQNLSKDMDVVMDWAGLSGAKFKDLTPEQSLNLHEKFAETFEQYLSSGNAPTPELKDVFNRFKSWMIQAYKTLQSLIKQTPRAELSQDIVDVMDNMLGAEKVRVASLFDDVLEGDAVANIINNNPDQEISVSRMRPDGEIEEITMTLGERLEMLEAEAKQAQQDELATQTAISCALQFGE